MHKLSRRHVIATLSASSVLLCPALLNAQVTHDWGGDVPENVPLGQDQLLMPCQAQPSLVSLLFQIRHRLPVWHTRSNNLLDLR